MKRERLKKRERLTYINMKTVKTPKGTELPIIQLKGKDYLQVMHRLQWFNEVESNFIIETTIVKADKEESIVQSKVTVFGPDGKIVKSATATKREDAKGFGDHLEKAETGATGRALALLGYGTQFATADLDEGNRIVDAPAISTKATSTANGPMPVTSPTFGSFRKPNNGATKTEAKT